MTVATGVGSMPGGDPTYAQAENARLYTEAVRIVLGELPDLPHLPELPGRGPAADMIGRTTSLLELPVDLQPAGWRLTSAVGIDQRRAASLLAQDLDTVEELAGDHDGPFKVQLTGPWTLAACVERPRGDRVLADHGARRELAQALAEAVGAHVGDLRRRLPRVTDLIVQLDEPALPTVLAGQVPTASGFSRHRSVHPPAAAEALGWVLTAIADAGAVPVVHCCAAEVPIGLLRSAGARGISVDLSLLDAAGHDDLATAVEAGERVHLGVSGVGGTDDEPGVAVLRQVERWLDMLGLAPYDGLAITPACGLADAADARQSLSAVREAARRLA
ncbi:methionine synthase [Nocardioides limicola]|uniref:methionine synthase n=1 Tax=Nocardioides limicola TaxID=2803368 RepID=UPI00193C7445|nr:methionine synthase [Nocardioides sp. DJM-14]